MWPAAESWRSVALGARLFLRMFVRPNLIAPRSGSGRTGGTLTILRRGAPTKFASHSEYRRRDARCRFPSMTRTVTAELLAFPHFGIFARLRCRRGRCLAKPGHYRVLRLRPAVGLARVATQSMT